MPRSAKTARANPYRAKGLPMNWSTQYWAWREALRTGKGIYPAAAAHSARFALSGRASAAGRNNSRDLPIWWAQHLAQFK